MLKSALSSLSCLCVLASTGSAAPMFWGNPQIAQRLQGGEAHMVLVGDSLQNRAQAEYLKRWPVEKTIGQFVSSNVGVDTGAYTFPWFNNAFVRQWAGRLPDEPSLVPNLPPASPGAR